MAGEELDKDTSASKEAKAAVIDKTPNEHQRTAQANFDKEDYATNNQYGQDLSGIKYKEGIEDFYGDDASIGENDIKRMMDAGYSSDDVYNFSKKRGLNYNQHGQKYMKGQGDYQIGKGSDQWGDVFGSSDKKESKESKESVQTASAVNSGTGNANNNSASISSTINGNNNNVDQSVTQNINNSRTYGGTNKSFTYNGSTNGNNYEDTPVSAGTIAGHFYDGDSPTKSAAFLDRYTTMNDDYQKSYENRGRAQTAINAASKNEAIDFDQMDERIGDRAKASRARSTVMAGDIFGDMWNYKAPDWRNPDKMEEVEAPDFKKLGKI